MNQKKSAIISGGAIIAVIIGILIAFNMQSDENSTNQDFEVSDNIGPDVFQPLPNNWQSSGPFKINRDKYLLGENIFIVGDGLETTDVGQMAILFPKNQTYYQVYTTIPFDGSEKLGFNSHFTPQLSKFQGICTKDELVGTWKVVFQGTQYENLEFEIINEILLGEEWKLEPHC